MAIMIDVLPSDAPASSTYSTNMFMHGILLVRLGNGQWKPRPNLSNLYPVLIDLYEDGSMRKLEVHIRHVKHYVHAELVAPKQCQVGRIIVLEEDAAAHLPDVWFSSDHSVFYAQAIRNPTKSVRHIQIADHVIVDVTAENMIAGLWLLELPLEVRTSCSQSRYIHDASTPKV